MLENRVGRLGPLPRLHGQYTIHSALLPVNGTNHHSLAWRMAWTRLVDSVASQIRQECLISRYLETICLAISPFQHHDPTDLPSLSSLASSSSKSSRCLVALIVLLLMFDMMRYGGQ